MSPSPRSPEQIYLDAFCALYPHKDIKYIEDLLLSHGCHPQTFQDIKKYHSVMLARIEAEKN
jgi:hypothetical protein